MQGMSFLPQACAASHMHPTLSPSSSHEKGGDCEMEEKTISLKLPNSKLLFLRYFPGKSGTYHDFARA